MKEQGMVLSLKGGKILITPVLTEACSSCSGGCDKKKTVFSAVNPSAFTLKEGSLVTFEVSSKSKAIQGIFSLLIPFLCAVAGFLISEPVMNLFGKHASDGIQAAFVLSLLLISSLIIFVITRIKPLPGKVTIIEAK